MAEAATGPAVRGLCLSDSDIIRLLALLHGDPDPAGPSGSPLPQWTTLVHSPLGPVGHIRDAVHDTLFWPGTKNLLDVYLDVDAWPIDMGGRIDKIAPGFMAKPVCLKPQLDRLLTAPLLRVAGHSKGAAEAQDFAALRLSEGRGVAEIVVFGSPMPGCEPMRTFLATVPMRSYRNGPEGADPVTTVPEPIPMFFPCVQMRAFITLDGKPDAGDTSEFRFHHSQCYWRGLTALANAQPKVA